MPVNQFNQMKMSFCTKLPFFTRNQRMASLLFAFCCSLLIRLDASEVIEASGHVGGNVSIRCFGNRTPLKGLELHSVLFCKGICSVENIIIQMKIKSSAVTWDGRYTMQLDGEDGVFTVTINQLRKADAGSYVCGMIRTSNVSDQEVILKVVDDSTVSSGSSPSTCAPTQMDAPSFTSNIESSNRTITVPASKRKRKQKEANNFTDMMVVIIISGSLAFLVCAIIPLIFYRRWRIMAGRSRFSANKNEDDRCQENIDTASTQVAVGVQTSEEEAHPESGTEDNLQNAAVYEGLDPKTLE